MKGKETSREVSVKDYYNRNAAREWDRLSRNQYSQIEYRVTSHYLEQYLPTNGHVLDAGAGPGRYSIDLARKGYKVSIFDLSQDELEIARKKSEELDIGSKICDISQGSIVDLSIYDDEKFDAVICLGGPLSHVMSDQDRSTSVKEMNRVAKPGAPIITSVMSRFGQLSNIVRYSPDDVDRINEFLTDGDHLHPETGVFTFTHFFTPEELKSLINSSGFNDTQLFSVQSLASNLRVEVNNLSPELFSKWVDVFTNISGEPSLLSTSTHILAVAKK